MKTTLPGLGLALLASLASLVGQIITLSPEKMLAAKAAAELRLNYAASSDYHPYDREVADLRQRASELMRNKSYAEALAAADRGLVRDRFNIQLLIVKAAALRATGDTAKADEVRQHWMTLMDSILTSGDGRSFSSALQVITIDEEYAVLQVLGAGAVSQSLVEHEGGHFDVLTVKDAESGKESQLYFNVDRPLHWLNASRAKSAGKPDAAPGATAPPATPAPAARQP